ncbi:ABC transporter permease [Subtercola sp. RTI3]|uniref:ABC transporter permease n=1 Tax=Subtercola sp. RTI3 TaxID=3048639 RepID=UPI002B2373A9|nr:ABC transporter permease [Subtercola sp. RTI3]MEA9985609.1 ABC transporter permease [Subtercola sp. RTI3]
MFARYISGRVLQAVLVLWAAYTVTFVVLYLLPSDPVQLLLAAGNIDVTQISPDQLAALKHQYGLDQPVYLQYVNQLFEFVRGNFGESITKNVPVAQLLAQRLPSTLVLGASAVLLTIVLGVGTASLAVFAKVGWLRTVLSRLPAIGVSLPPFFVGLLLIQVFAFQLKWFPASGDSGAASVVLPAVMMAIPTAALLAQVLTRSLEDALDEPYVVTARAKGLSRSGIQWRHAFRNAALPAITLLGLLLGSALAEAVVAETIFTRNGIGKLAQESVLQQDVPVVQAIVVIAAALFVSINLIIDLIYPLLDPRIVRGHSVI